MSRGRILFKLGVILLVAAVGVLVFMAPVSSLNPIGTADGFSGPLSLPVVLIGLASLLVAAGMARMILARRGYAQRVSSPRKRKNEFEPEAYRSFDDLVDLGAIPLADDELPELSEDDLFLDDEKPKRSGAGD